MYKLCNLHNLCFVYDFRVRYWRHGYRLLEQPIEQQAPRRRSSTIEPEDELIEVIVQLAGLDRTMMGAQ
jgi:hypothetical protein